MVGDYLIESECEAGHASSATLRGHARDVAYAVARTLDDRCRWPAGDEDCGRRVSHVVTDLGPPESVRRSEPEPRTPPRRTATKPSMPAVIVVPSAKRRPPVEVVENDGLVIDRGGDETASTEPPPETRDAED